jgi:uncharacterized protein HemX
MILSELEAKLALGALALMTAIAAGLGVWALLERAGRLECKVELVQAIDQGKVLEAALERQSKAIDKVAAQSAAVIARTGRILDTIETEHLKTRQTIDGLELVLASATPTGEDGKIKTCADALREWRAEPAR